MRPVEKEKPEQEPMPVRRHARTLLFRALVGGVVAVAAVLGLWITGSGGFLWDLFSDRERIQSVVSNAGLLAPVVYVVLLVAQAVLAPLPALALALWERVTPSGSTRASC